MAAPPLPPPQFFHSTGAATAPDSPTPLSLLPQCSSLRELKQVHAFAIKTHLLDYPSTITRLIGSCTARPNAASMAHARKLFDQVSHPDTILFNILSRGYSRLNSGLSLEAVSLFVRVLAIGLTPDDYTFPSLLKACAVSKALQEGKQLHCFALKLGLVDHNIFVSPTLINMYTECGDVNGARRVFNSVKSPCVVTYNSMITGYARASRPNETLSMFREMQARDLVPNDVTMLSVLSSCALLGSLDLGKWVHEHVKKNEFDRFVKVNTALIDMYAKCGSLEDAVSVFREMELRDTQAWSAIIMAHGTHGRSFEAISMYEEMKRARVPPDEITFLGLLYACSQTGLIEEGYKFFRRMSEECGINPGIKHYGCMVDLLGRAGRLEEAYNFINELPIKPTPILWRTLLSACSSHDNVQMGKQVVEQIFKLDDSHGGDYVIFSNMCSRAGHWEEVDRMRKLMGDRGAVKVPGCSSIELHNVVHEFFSGDGVRSISMAIHRSADELFKELKLVGYVPDTSLIQILHLILARTQRQGLEAWLANELPYS
ncbi:hypothetical protein CDL15_Pgr009585 [Punica granatum]|uniref:Uncharacterized protein n=1 Tax=Punica granatum TaxID=22663 RepID=A0A218WU86_PUNGR|nr:hypothetical protein CDL15_Pgr009585 [Punica granatum]